MKKNQIFIYNAPKISFISNYQSEFSSDNEMKIINKSKLPNNIINRKLKIDTIIKNNNNDLISSRKINDNSMNKLNTKRTHLSDEINSLFEQKEKYTVPNIYKNISTTKNKNQKEIIIISKTNNKSSINSEIDCLNEKKIEKDKDKNFKKNIIKYFDDIDHSDRGLKDEER